MQIYLIIEDLKKKLYLIIKTLSKGLSYTLISVFHQVTLRTRRNRVEKRDEILLNTKTEDEKHKRYAW